MTDDLLYPCGVDCLGVALKVETSPFVRMPYQTRPILRSDDTVEGAFEHGNLAKLMPWLVDAVVLLPAGAGCKFIVRPDRPFRVDMVHAVGPCELLEVEYLGEQFLPHAAAFGARRWVYVSKIIQPGQDLVCQLFCVPGLFMLADKEQGPDTVLVTSGQPVGGPR